MPPRTPKQFEAIRTESKKAIKQAALLLFSRNGLNGTRIEDIAREAKISKGLLYNYYGSKEKLLHDILADAINSGKRVLQELVDSDKPAKDKLASLIETTFTMMQKDFHYWKLMGSLSYQDDILKDSEAVVGTYLEEMTAIKVALFKAMGSTDPVLDTYALGAVLDGVFVQYIHLGGAYPLDEMKTHIIVKFIGDRKEDTIG